MRKGLAVSVIIICSLTMFGLVGCSTTQGKCPRCEQSVSCKELTCDACNHNSLKFTDSKDLAMQCENCGKHFDFIHLSCGYNAQ
mgnify:CR=1 FL=1